ncbi:MAG TPA: NAD(P)/FAD-dependent oxidoreductase [Pyrinomonadaceae bacterium]
MNEASDSFDVVIVGGGPAGTSAAIHLAKGGARVALAEKKKFPRAKLCGEFISPECLEHFERLGVTERMMAAGGAKLTETVFYSRSGRSVNVPSDWFGAGHSGALGLSRAEMDARLMTRAREAGVRVLEETQASGLLIDEGHVRGVRLKGRDGQPFELLSPLTIDATGRSRALARRVERETNGRYHRSKSAPLVAFKAHLEDARGAADHCEIYFYRGGYGGLSRVEGGLSNLCFIARARDVRACGGDAERVMRAVVTKNLRAAETLAHARAISGWLAVALEGFGRGPLIPARGMMSVGDAASFIDPFTGSGMLMALEGGELAAQTIARHLRALRSGDAFDNLAREYRARYDQTFGARLRVCALMRRAAFVPRLAETLIFALGASRRARKRLARSTRLRKALTRHEG